MSKFDEAVLFALNQRRSKIVLKPQQKQILWSVVVKKKDVLGVLPTGFGKSLVFQTLSHVWDFFYECPPSSCTIVVSPLNALMKDQIGKLCHLGVIILDGSKQNRDLAENLISTGKLQVIFGHPEVFVNHKDVRKLLKSVLFQRNIKAIVIDEAHLVDEWKNFRPAFSKLSSLCSLFPNAPVVALTATATQEIKSKIINSVGLNDPIVVEVSPDRKNIYYESRPRPNKKEERNFILSEFVKDLREKRVNMPLTIFYGNLECCAESFMYFSSEMGDDQYEPLGAQKISKNRLFTQYHAQYPKHELERIMNDLVTGLCKHRVFFVTVAFGIGVDCSNIRHVVHLGVPLTMEEYCQEAGRAGRDGLPAKATMFYNSYNISQAKKGLQDVMIKFAKSSSSECKRALILNHFGYTLPHRENEVHNCCDFHLSVCSCSECKERMTCADCNIQSDGSTLNKEPKINTNNLTKSQIMALREKLINHKLSLGNSKSCVGNPSLSNGFSTELIELVIEHCCSLDSVETILKNLPVFSSENAAIIFSAIQDIMESN